VDVRELCQRVEPLVDLCGESCCREHLRCGEFPALPSYILVDVNTKVFQSEKARKTGAVFFL
jgi:hypothetical protein